ncbi:MAG TPA: hypothetical protein VLJ58_14070 [Ramlibacter sp.]|nr:hypothetical protein [Ramlibacter sp.]
MSLFSWFSSKKKQQSKSTADSSGLSRMAADPTRPVTGPGRRKQEPVSNGQPVNRKTERMARRELLYGVVRQAMMKAGVTSASYKFKVLSLDPRGRQFLVMVDLAREHGGETSRLAEIEATIAQEAKSRFDIVVSAVYWRMNEHVAVGVAEPAVQAVSSRPMPLESQPAVLEAAPARPQPVAAADTAQKLPGRYEPLEDDEVAAFKKAFAAGTRPAAPAGGATARAFDGSAKHGPQSYTLLTGYEDTELPDSSPALSGTQYGELR